MTDRDRFAAAALTGLLDKTDAGKDLAAWWPEMACHAAYRWADAMLRERSRSGKNSSGGTDSAAKCTERDSANHDAAPAARASVESVAPQPTAGDRAGNPPSHSGTGDTPATHATRGEGSERREGTEPVAWAVCCPGDGNWSPCFFHEQHAQRHASAILGSKNIVPLYRQPPCQDFSQKNLTLTDAEREAIRFFSLIDGPGNVPVANKRADTLRGLLERLGGAR